MLGHSVVGNSQGFSFFKDMIRPFLTCFLVRRLGEIVSPSFLVRRKPAQPLTSVMVVWFAAGENPSFFPVKIDSNLNDSSGMKVISYIYRMSACCIFEKIVKKNVDRAQIGSERKSISFVERTEPAAAAPIHIIELKNEMNQSIQGFG